MPPQTNPPTPVPGAMTNTAVPAEHTTVKEPQCPSLPATARAPKQAPRATVWKLLQAQVNLDLNAPETNRGSRHFSSNYAQRPQPRNADRGQIVLKDHCVHGTIWILERHLLTQIVIVRSPGGGSPSLQSLPRRARGRKPKQNQGLGGN